MLKWFIFLLTSHLDKVMYILGLKKYCTPCEHLLKLIECNHFKYQACCIGIGNGSQNGRVGTEEPKRMKKTNCIFFKRIPTVATFNFMHIAIYIPLLWRYHWLVCRPVCGIRTRNRWHNPLHLGRLQYVGVCRDQRRGPLDKREGGQETLWPETLSGLFQPKQHEQLQQFHHASGPADVCDHEAV